MNAFTTLPPADRAIVRRPERLIALSRVLDSMKDVELEATIELLIAMRDARDVDPDVEANGDETDHTNAEDEGRREGCSGDGSEPGCPISDPGELVGDEGDVAWTEWHGRNRQALRMTSERVGAPSASEDDEESDHGEDDDPAGGDVDDDGEVGAWMERGDGAQPVNMMGGADHWHLEEDEEPRFVPASMDRLFAANAS